MPKNVFSNPCIRCGKERITVRVYKEKIGGSTIIQTETACPDSGCQTLVLKLLEKERIQKERLINNNQPWSRTGRVQTPGNVH